MTKLVRTKTGARPWVTEVESEGGGGGGIPNPITDPLNVVLTDPGSVPVSAQGAPGQIAALFNLSADGGFLVAAVSAAGAFLIAPTTDDDPALTVQNSSGGTLLNLQATKPIVPQTSPSVQDVIDALVALDLITQSD